MQTLIELTCREEETDLLKSLGFTIRQHRIDPQRFLCTISLPNEQAGEELVERLLAGSANFYGSVYHNTFTLIASSSDGRSVRSPPIESYGSVVPFSESEPAVRTFLYISGQIEATIQELS